MDGTYDPGLVALSYLIASMAGFVAISFASRMLARRSRRLPWLLGGSLAMGTGIWSMHFVGMTAFSLPVAISYDIGLTLLSWAAAVGVSALALFIVGYGHLRASTLALGAVVMGAGICAMHYGGMWAMRMSPVIVYDTVLLLASIVIAVVASGAALLILASLKDTRSWRDVALRVGASLVMGVAVCGMHYTGMAAADFPADAFCSPLNQLPAQSLPWPTAIGTLLILGFGIHFTIGDARDIARAQREKREHDARVLTYAFTDIETGLPNRAALWQEIPQRARAGVPGGFVVMTFRAEGPDGQAPELAAITRMQQCIQQALPGATLARTRPEHLVVLLDGSNRDAMYRCAPLFAQIERELAAQGGHVLSVNSAHCPTDGESAQGLLLRSAPKGVGNQAATLSAA